jgi:hypothetical protein
MGSARAGLVVSAVVLVALAWVSAAFAGVQSFTAPGTYVFAVPAGVTSVHVVAVGASGGAGGSGGGVGGAGGLGAVVQGTLAVSPGSTLEVNVGGQGDEGLSAVGVGGGGGGGGGASDVRTGPALADRVLVAGGGGGGGGTGTTGTGGLGGGGGGREGAPGICDGSGEPGGGGTQDAGGAGGRLGSYEEGIDGEFGVGGGGGLDSAGGAGGFNGGGPGGLNFGVFVGRVFTGHGGGGGGGWYGGGGGAPDTCGGGGGGGSNHAGAGVSGFTEGLAAVPGDGSVTLSWAEPAGVPVLESLSPVFGGAGTVVTLTGEGLAGATGVLFGEAGAAFVVVSDTQIRAVAPAQPLLGVARAPQGLAAALPVVVVGPGGASNALSFTYTTGVGVPGPCDPLVKPCAGPGHGQPGTPAFAPPADGGGGAAVGQARMPNLRATVSGRWRDGTVRVTVRVLVSESQLVQRWFLVRVRIPSLDVSREVRVRAHAKQVVTLRLRFAASASATGKRVLVRVDPTNRILETSRKDNTASARIA